MSSLFQVSAALDFGGRRLFHRHDPVFTSPVRAYVAITAPFGDTSEVTG